MLTDISKNIHRIIFMNYRIIIPNQDPEYLLSILKKRFCILIIPRCHKCKSLVKQIMLSSPFSHYKFLSQKVTNSIHPPRIIRPFNPFTSTNSVQSSTKYHQISHLLRLRWTRIQNIPLRSRGTSP